MRRFLIILLLVLAGSLLANPTYYPLTSIAEGFFASWCGTCPQGMAGIQILDDTAHNGELINLRYYTTSGDLSSPTVDDRINHYQVFGVPAMIFNGKIRIDGGGTEISDGSAYTAAYRHFRYGSSPLKMDLPQWNPATGSLSGSIQMISPTLNLSGAQLFYLLIENNVDAEATRVVRTVASSTFNLTGENAIHPFSHQFVINPAWNQANLWVAAFVQLADNSILQTASSLSLPAYNFRIAADWDPENLVSPMNSTYNSPTMWFYNLGTSDNYTMEIVVDSAPENWWFNYCDEEGTCLPGSAQIPMSLAAGEHRGYHLNIIVGGSGTAHFKYRIISPELGTYEMPFVLRTDDIVANNDQLNPAATISLGANYPNPFRGSTSFSLSSEKTGEDWIEIYNSKGQRVDSIPANLHGGEQQISWQAPQSLASGIYLYKLRNSQTQIRRMLLIK
jgi:hypothetical protein